MKFGNLDVNVDQKNHRGQVRIHGTLVDFERGDLVCTAEGGVCFIVRRQVADRVTSAIPKPDEVEVASDDGSARVLRRRGLQRGSSTEESLN